MAESKTKTEPNIPGPRELSQQALANDVLDLFELQYSYARPHLDDMNQAGQCYNQVIDPQNWATSAEITLGQAFSLVQNILPAIMYLVLWSPETPYECIPANKNTTFEVARKIRDNLVYTQRERMNLEVEGMFAILDALKYGIGFTLVEPRAVQSAGFGTRYATAGNVAESMTTLGIGATIDVTSCRHIPAGRVYPTPDGEEPGKVSAVTVLDYVSEGKLREMFARPDNPYRGDPEEIIEYARKMELSGYTAGPRQIADFLSRRTQAVVHRMNKTGQSKLPVLIPMLLQFRENHHIYLACDKFPIYEIKDQFQTLEKPLAKATYAPEGNEWFTKGIVGRTHDATVAIEQWVNAMMDLLSLSLHPHKIVNTQSLAQEDIQEDIAPYGTTLVRGDPRTAIDFVKYPAMPAQAYSVPDQIESFVNKVTGAGPTPQASTTPGLVRGGTGALESLLQVSTGREKATAKHIENGWYKRITLLTLIYNQLLINEKDEYTELATATATDEGKKPGEKFFKVASVTTDEIRQEFRLEFNFREKLHNFLAESAHRIQVYTELKNNPTVSEEELVRYLIGDEYMARRLTQGVDVDKRRAEIQAMLAGPREGANLAPMTAGRGQGIAV